MHLPADPGMAGKTHPFSMHRPGMDNITARGFSLGGSGDGRRPRGPNSGEAAGSRSEGQGAARIKAGGGGAESDEFVRRVRIEDSSQLNNIDTPSTRPSPRGAPSIGQGETRGRHRQPTACRLAKLEKHPK